MTDTTIIHGLKLGEDSFGNNIFDAFHSGDLYSGFEIVERDDGRFTLNGDSNAYFETYEFWNKSQQTAADRISGVVLDVGCGGGKHAMHFQNKGSVVYAMDNSPLAIETCRLQGLKNTILCDVEHFEAFETDIKFDVIAFWGNNLGLMQNRSFFIYFLNVLEGFSHKNTRIYFESMDPYGIGFQDQETVEYVQNNLKQKKLGGQMHVRVRYKKHVTPWSDYLFVSQEELQEILSQSNWVVNEFINDLESHQYIAEVVKRNQ